MSKLTLEDLNVEPIKKNVFLKSRGEEYHAENIQLRTKVLYLEKEIRDLKLIIDRLKPAAISLEAILEEARRDSKPVVKDMVKKATAGMIEKIARDLYGESYE